LTAWYLCASFIILLTATVVLYFILVANLRRDHDQFLIGKIGVIRALLRDKPDDLYSLKEEVEQTWAPRQYVRVYGRVINASGQIMAESPAMGARLPADIFPSPSPADQDPEQGVPLRLKADESLRAVSAMAQVGHDPRNKAVIQVALDTQLSGQLLAGYRRTLLMVLGIGLAICAVTGYWLARSGLRPLRRITQTVQQIHSSTLDQRVPTARLPAELSSLVASFNSMLERLQESFDRLSRFSADIAHELRTPVNNLRIEVEVALNKARSMDEYQETLGSCLEECGRLSRIIDSMLFIARAEDPRTQIHKESVDVGTELERVREFYEAPAGEAGVDLRVSCPSGTYAPVDRTLFQRAVGNLVANAIRHTPKR
jgi:two-component system heavy metal sensor histidine kinase CusS